MTNGADSCECLLSQHSFTHFWYNLLISGISEADDNGDDLEINEQRFFQQGGGQRARHQMSASISLPGGMTPMIEDGKIMLGDENRVLPPLALQTSEGPSENKSGGRSGRSLQCLSGRQALGHSLHCYRTWPCPPCSDANLTWRCIEEPAILRLRAE